MSKSVESAPVSNQSEVSAPVASVQHVPMGEQILSLMREPIAFSDLRQAAQRLGVSSKRNAKGDVISTDPIDRATFLLLLSRYAKHQAVSRGQLIELSGLSRTIAWEGDRKSEGVGAVFFAEGKIAGDKANLGTVKVKAAGKAGNVSFD